MSDRERVHVDEEHLVILELDVLCVIISMQHVVIMRNGLNKRKQLSAGLLRKDILYELNP